MIKSAIMLHVIYARKTHLHVSLEYLRNIMKTPYCIYRLKPYFRKLLWGYRRPPPTGQGMYKSRGRRPTLPLLHLRTCLGYSTEGTMEITRVVLWETVLRGVWSTDVHDKFTKDHSHTPLKGPPQ